jgi:uncharacterized phage infection (PIP) family protein YhgE
MMARSEIGEGEKAVLSVQHKNPVFLPLVALVVALTLSVSLTSCQNVQDQVQQGVDQVEQQVVTEAKKMVWSYVSDGLNQLKDTIRSNQGKGVDWAQSQVANVREGLKPVLDQAADRGLTGLGWIDEELQKLEQKLAGYENPDQVIQAIDEFIADLKAKLELSE